MIASAIGKTFLDAYNAHEKTSYTAEEFFEKIFFPLFYDDEKYMQWVLNSAFDQLSKQKKHGNPPDRRDTLNKLKKDVVTIKPHAGIAVGFAAGNKLDSKGQYVTEYATTSSQVSTLTVPLDSETLYLSWIGSGLGVGVQGGLCIFLNHADILLKLFEGWSLYRNSFLNKITKLKGSQIETWNGQWLAHRLSDEFIEEYPISGLNNALDKAGERLETQSWLRVLSGVALHYSADSLTGYVYSYGQTNRSIGFIPFVLPQIKRPLTLFRKLFSSQIKLEAEKIEDLFGTEFGFLKACEMGSIGLKAMEPKGVRAYVGTTENAAKIPKYPKNADSQPLTFSIYITWVIAMLNNEELWNQAETYAQNLVNYEAGAGKGRTDRKNEVKSFLTASFQKPILTALSVIAEKAEQKEQFLELGKTIHFLPKDNVPYFMTLIRFRYAFLTK